MIPRSKILFAVLLCLLTFQQAQANETDVDYDTTRVRQVQPVKKSVSEKLADVPGELLKLPIYVFEQVAYFLTTEPPVSSLVSLFPKQSAHSAFTPVVGYGSRRGFKFGVGVDLLSNGETDNHLKFKFYYSTNKYQLLRLKFGSPQFFSERLGLELNTSYRKETRRGLYGTGITSARESEVNLGLEKTNLQMQIPWQIGKSLQVALGAGYQVTNYSDGQDPDLEGRIDTILSNPILGLQPEQLDPIRSVNVGLALALDSRNSKARPTAGGQLFAGFERILGVGRSEGRDFDRINIEFQQFLNVWRERVLALRSSFSRIDELDLDNDGTPYHLASKLGGIDYLRGYSTSRFLDNDALHLTLEYRYPIYDHLDAFLFVDEGRVFSDVTKEVVLKHWRNSFGFGVRAWNTERTIAVIQIARSEESVRFYFDFGATW